MQLLLPLACQGEGAGGEVLHRDVKITVALFRVSMHP